MSVEYTGGNIAVTIGQRASVKLPPRTLRARLTGMLFESAKTFLLPRAMKGIRQLVRFYHDHPGVKVLVNGHTDTQGPADYNRGLSMERADAIAHYLVDAVDEWLKWYDGKACSDRWGVREDQYMLASLRPEKKQPPYYDPERINGKLDDETRAALKRFQKDNGVAESGTPDKATRTRLVKAYMALDGTTLQGSPPPLQRHGCGLFHLEVPTGSNVDEPRNRRVEIYLFEGDIKPAPTSLCRWGGCAEYPLWKSSARETIDLDLEPGHITVTAVDEKGKPAGDAELEVSGASSESGKTDGDGHAEFADLPPGQYTVVAKKKGYLPASIDVTVKPEIDAHADVALSRSELRVFEEGGDPEAAKDDLTAPDGAALTLRWRIHGEWKKVELRNVAIDKTVDLAHYTTEQGEVDIGYAPLVLRSELGNQSTSDGGYRAEMELTVVRPDDSKDKPRRAVVRVTPASAANGGRFIDYVAAEIENSGALGLKRRRRIG